MVAMATTATHDLSEAFCHAWRRLPTASLPSRGTPAATHWGQPSVRTSVPSWAQRVWKAPSASVRW